MDVARCQWQAGVQRPAAAGRHSRQEHRAAAQRHAARCGARSGGGLGTCRRPARPPSGQDKELEQRRQQAEAAEAAKQKAAQEVQAKARAENCARARQNKASLDSGIRITRTNAQGEREFLDDAQRAAETRRTQDIIARDCAPNAQLQ